MSIREDFKNAIGVMCMAAGAAFVGLNALCIAVNLTAFPTHQLTAPDKRIATAHDEAIVDYTTLFAVVGFGVGFASSSRRREQPTP